MKTIALMLLLGISVGCCLLALSSCGGGGGSTAATGTSADDSTAASTEPGESTGAASAPATDPATLSTEPPACEHEWGKGMVTVAATCGKTGIKIYTCSKCGIKLTEKIPATGDHMFQDDALFYVVEPTESADGEYCKICSICGAEQRLAAKYENYRPKYEAAVNAVEGFTDGQFGGSTHSEMPTDRYDPPTVYPTANRHPRLLFTDDDLEAFHAAFRDPAFHALAHGLIVSANSSETGVLPAAPSGGNNVNQSVLNVAASKALLYRITGVKLYGYEAILVAKNYLSTFEINGGFGNPERYYGETMFYMALVYDWCYDLLSGTDRDQFIAGVQHKCCEGGKMEIGFPPSSQGVVGDHGCERQLLRDYLSFSLAICDEEPTWYAFVGGRFFEEYVPARNEFYESGYSPQGTSIYMSLRYCADLWSAWIMKSATGAVPYDEANMKQVMRSVYTRVVDGKSLFFEEGDDEDRDVLKNPSETLKQYALPAQISAYLFGDPTVAAWADYTGYAYTANIFRFLLNTRTPEPAKNRYEDLDLILYNGGYLSQMIAHTGWTANDATILMKIGNRTTANHDHAEAGAFQIYYKGLLAGDSGFYDSYGSTHHKAYHRATIAHNSIVFYRSNSGGFTTLQQRNPSDAGSYINWQTDTYTTGETTGYAYAYADAEEKIPVYAYIAGNFAAAYEAGVADEVTRRMLAVFDTGRDDVKAYFFVFDHIVAKNASDEKVFLLHTVEEPQVNGKTVTITAGGGKLVLQNLFGGDRIETVGGAGNNYSVNGAQVKTKNNYDDGYWGRLEISPSKGKKTDDILNVMYLCDGTDDVALEAIPIETNSVSGGIIGNTAAVFIKKAERRNTAFTFTANGEGELNYYVSGVAAGTWIVSAGGVTETLRVTEESGLLTFTAPAGYVSLGKQ